VIAMVLMLCGVGLFGVLSGFVASLLLGKKAEEENSELAEIRAQLARIEKKLDGGAVESERPPTLDKQRK
jgi:hypothetical protein